MDVCLLCGDPIDHEKKTENNTCRQPRIKILSDASFQRLDGKHEELKKHTSIVVHKNCNITYVRESAIKKARKINEAKKNISSTSDRSLTTNDSKYDQLCLICGEDASAQFINAQIKKELKKEFALG